MRPEFSLQIAARRGIKGALIALPIAMQMARDWREFIGYLGAGFVAGMIYDNEIYKTILDKWEESKK